MPEFYNRLPITQRIVVSFLGVIALGSLVLSLPWVFQKGVTYPGYFDVLFNTVSIVCVTGLNTFSVGLTYNMLGQAIVMALIQIGGLGLVTLVSLSYYAINRRMSLSEQTLLKSSLAYETSKDLKQYLFGVYKVTFVLEAIMTAYFLIDFVPRFGWKHGLFNSLFLAVSSFCNAGFDNLPTSHSLTALKTNPIITSGVMFLIFSGAIGFPVWTDLAIKGKIFLKQRPRRLLWFYQSLRPSTLLTLKTTVILLMLGTLSFWLVEAHNPATIGHLNFWQQGWVSLFQAVTMRSAGFTTIDFNQTHLSTNFLFMLQMMMGGGPGGTAGGVKLAIVAIVALLFVSEIRGQKHVTFQQRIISNETIRQTLTILIFFTILLFAGFFILLITENGKDPFQLAFEATSALSTVGVTMDTTSQLTRPGQWVIMALIFIGRVGPLTVLMGLLQTHKRDSHYPQTDIILG